MAGTATARDGAEGSADAARDPLAISPEVKASLNLLIVDDDRTLREGCASVLQLDGYNVTTLGRGDEAIDLVKRRRFDIILVDLYMTPVSGMEILKATLAAHKDTIVIVMTLVASNLVHGRIGRMWTAVRDMDIAAELMGIRLLRTKLLAFAVSSFYCGVSGAMLVFLWYGGAESTVFNINQSFALLFMIIIGGLGSLLGSLLGAALIYILPIALRFVPGERGLALHAATVEHVTFMIVGALIVFFLIVEPAGLARLWQIGKQKLRVWPFPY